MSGINKVILIGNVGSINTKDTKDGNQVVSVSIATSIKYQDKRTGEDVEQTEWHNVTFFKKLAEIAAQYINKGTKIYVEGYLKTEKWQSKSGEDRYTTKIIANQMQLLSSKKDSDSSSSYSAENSAKEYKKAKEESDAQQEDFSDPIPF